MLTLNDIPAEFMEYIVDADGAFTGGDRAYLRDSMRARIIVKAATR